MITNHPSLTIYCILKNTKSYHLFNRINSNSQELPTCSEMGIKWGAGSKEVSKNVCKHCKTMYNSCHNLRKFLKTVNDPVLVQANSFINASTNFKPHQGWIKNKI